MNSKWGLVNGEGEVMVISLAGYRSSNALGGQLGKVR
jgi:hypothetical protein